MVGDAIPDVIAAENVRLLINGRLCGPPLEGTLAYRVFLLVAIASLNAKGLP